MLIQISRGFRLVVTVRAIMPLHADVMDIRQVVRQVFREFRFVITIGAVMPLHADVMDATLVPS